MVSSWKPNTNQILWLTDICNYFKILLMMWVALMKNGSLDIKKMIRNEITRRVYLLPTGMKDNQRACLFWALPCLCMLQAVGIPLLEVSGLCFPSPGFASLVNHLLMEETGTSQPSFLKLLDFIYAAYTSEPLWSRGLRKYLTPRIMVNSSWNGKIWICI